MVTVSLKRVHSTSARNFLQLLPVISPPPDPRLPEELIRAAGLYGPPLWLGLVVSGGCANKPGLSFCALLSTTKSHHSHRSMHTSRTVEAGVFL